jgi:sn-glycerol 3-phosphate transport system ATP-binding protein
MEQVGTPEEVYHRPATTFVASFIGSPPMNLLNGRADGTRFTVEGGQTLALPAPAPRDGDLLLGVRPEHVDPAAEGWTLHVEVVEMLGAERLIYGRLGDAAFTARLDATLVAPAMGDRLTLAVEARHLHWFDPQTQQRVA